MHAVFVLLLIKFTIAVANARKLELTNIVCNSSDVKFLKFENCHLKAINRSYHYIAVAQRMHQVHFRNFVANLQTMKRASGWRPWLYNLTVNVCRFFRGPNKPVVKFLLGLVATDFDFIENCNAKNRTFYSVNVSNANVLKGLNSLPLPGGEYAVFSVWTSKNVQFTINVFARYEP